MHVVDELIALLLGEGKDNHGVVILLHHHPDNLVNIAVRSVLSTSFPPPPPPSSSPFALRCAVRPDANPSSAGAMALIALRKLSCRNFPSLSMHR